MTEGMNEETSEALGRCGCFLCAADGWDSPGNAADMKCFVSSADWQQGVQLYLLLASVPTAGLGQQRQTHPTVGPSHQRYRRHRFEVCIGGATTPLKTPLCTARRLLGAAVTDLPHRLGHRCEVGAVARAPARLRLPGQLGEAVGHQKVCDA